MQHFGALDEDFAAVEIGEQVDVALAIAQFDVGQAVELLRQREHGLGEEGQALDVHGELAGAGAEQVAGDADVVAEVEQLVEREALFADGVEADVDLQALAALLQGGEARLALRADGHDAAGDRHRHAIGFQVFGRRLRSTWRAPPEWCARQGTGWDRPPGPASRSLQFRLAQFKEIALKLRFEHVSSFPDVALGPKGKYTRCRDGLYAGR